MKYPLLGLLFLSSLATAGTLERTFTLDEVGNYEADSKEFYIESTDKKDVIQIYCIDEENAVFIFPMFGGDDSVPHEPLSSESFTLEKCNQTYKLLKTTKKENISFKVSIDVDAMELTSFEVIIK